MATLQQRFRQEYSIWKDMKRRCSDKRRKSWKNYGGRDIRVCRRWAKSFEHFLADMGPRPSNAHSIDRIDNDGNYTPSNCRWATDLQQARNVRTNKRITYNGCTRCLTEWAEHIGIPPITFWTRYFLLGWTMERIIGVGKEDGRSKGIVKEKTRSDNRMLTHNGETMPLFKWGQLAEKNGIGSGTFCYRIRNGWDIEKALTVPVHFHNRGFNVPQ